MNALIKYWSFICLFSFSICSAQNMTDSSTGKTFPETVTVEYQGNQHTLTGTGVATRKKFFVKVYSIASYIEDPSSVKGDDVFTNILNSKNPKQLTIQWARDVGQSKVRQGYRDALGKITGNAANIVKFSDIFGDVKSGDTHIIRWMPDGVVTVTINGEEKGKIEDEQFAKEIWSIWFGKSSVVDRDKLVSRIQ